MKLLFRLVYPFTVLTVDNEDETLSTGVVVPPERTNLVLASDVPDGEGDVLVLHGLDVKTCKMYEVLPKDTQKRACADQLWG